MDYSLVALLQLTIATPGSGVTILAQHHEKKLQIANQEQALFCIQNNVVIKKIGHLKETERCLLSSLVVLVTTSLQFPLASGSMHLILSSSFAINGLRISAKSDPELICPTYISNMLTFLPFVYLRNKTARNVSAPFPWSPLSANLACEMSPKSRNAGVQC
jgi:hypothetical protein